MARLPAQSPAVGRRPSIAFVSREVWPFLPGGRASALLAGAGRRHRGHQRALAWSFRGPSRSLGLAPRPAPSPCERAQGELSPYASRRHAWSVRLMAAVIEAHPEGGPDLIEAADYHGEGFAIAHALRGRDPRLRRTRLAVRLHTSAELTAKLDERPDDLISGSCEGSSARHRARRRGPGARGHGDGPLPPLSVPTVWPPRFAALLPVSSEMMPTARLEPPPSDGLLRILYLGRLQRLRASINCSWHFAVLTPTSCASPLPAATPTRRPGRFHARVRREPRSRGRPSQLREPGPAIRSAT